MLEICPFRRVLPRHEIARRLATRATGFLALNPVTAALLSLILATLP